MVKRLICFVIMFVMIVKAHVRPEKATPKLTINAISSNCAETSGMTAEQLRVAIQEKDVKKISACFFKCYLNHYVLVTREDGRDIVNVPVTLLFVKIYIPDISFIDILSVGAEVFVCAEDFEKITINDDEPSCSKTKVLVKCLAKRKMLMTALWLATGSYI